MISENWAEMRGANKNQIVTHAPENESEDKTPIERNFLKIKTALPRGKTVQRF